MKLLRKLDNEVYQNFILTFMFMNSATTGLHSLKVYHLFLDLTHPCQKDPA